MTEVTASIGRYDSDNRTVPVTFTSGGIVHQRAVNAVLHDDGTYDQDATALRVQDVARGVAVKIDLGVIAAPPSNTDAEV